MIDKYR